MSGDLSEKVTQLRELVEKANRLPWAAQGSELVEGTGTTFIGKMANWESRAVGEANTSLIVTAVNGLPALLDHCEDVLRRHQPELLGVRLCCSSCAMDQPPFALRWPCPEIESVSRLLDSLIPDKEAENG